MKLYLSGGIAGVENTTQRFGDAQLALESKGYEIVNPLEIDPCQDISCRDECDPEEPLHTWECYLKYDLVEMLQCDGVATLEGAEKSRGSRLEIFVAGIVDMRVATVRDWFNATSI